MEASPGTIVSTALVDRINEHDIDGLVACFADDVVSTTPAHPGRSFTGSGQVRRNWTQLLTTIPDLHVSILDVAVTTDGDAELVWLELGFDGQGPAGAFAMRGVTINRVERRRITAVRFYMEPRESGGPDADTAVREIVGAGTGTAPGAGR